MSKEVKRFIASLEGGFVEVVEAHDYDALLAERDLLRSALGRCRFDSLNMSLEDMRFIKAALQGEQL